MAEPGRRPGVIMGDDGAHQALVMVLSIPTTSLTSLIEPETPHAPP